MNTALSLSRPIKRKGRSPASTAVLVGLCILAILLVVPAAICFQGWIVMLIIGGLHGTVGWPASSVGFGGSVLIGVALAFLGSLLGFSKRS